MGAHGCHDHLPRKLTDAQKHFNKAVEAMTATEWNSLMRGIGIDNPPANVELLGELDEHIMTSWKDIGIDETCPKTYGPIEFENPLPF